MALKQPQIGDRYRDVGTPFRNAVWILTAVFISRDGIEHARLVSAGDATESKTLALSVVVDAKRFVPAEPRRVEVS
jgi:hypothetical protein